MNNSAVRQSIACLVSLITARAAAVGRTVEAEIDIDHRGRELIFFVDRDETVSSDLPCLVIENNVEGLEALILHFGEYL